MNERRECHSTGNCKKQSNVVTYKIVKSHDSEGRRIIRFRHATRRPSRMPRGISIVKQETFDRWKAAGKYIPGHTRVSR